jgi:ribonuclease VapC
MIVDSSALIAILRLEPEAQLFEELIDRDRHPVISAANFVEVGIVVDRGNDPIAPRLFDRVLAELGIEVVSITPAQAQIARQAHRDFGRGSGHLAGLNFGDCFAYALAVDRNEALLYKGNDFVHTDVQSALE